jgi:streptogramin lyase
MLTRRRFLAAAAVGAFAGELRSRPAKVERMFDSPAAKPNGLQATAEGLWILGQGDNRVCLVRYEDGKLLRALETECDRGSGITFDGEALWLASTYNRAILRVDAKTGKTLEKHDTPGAGPVQWTQSRVSPLAPKPEPRKSAPRKNAPPRQATGAHGLEWKDGKLWVATPPSKKIYKIDPKAWKIELQFATAGDRPHGLGWERDWLWCADSNLNAFFKHDARTGAILEKIQLADSDPLPHGMTIRKGWMWYCDDVGPVCRLKM